MALLIISDLTHWEEWEDLQLIRGKKIIYQPGVIVLLCVTQ